MRNEVVMDQLILFHKPNKKVRSEKKMGRFIPQTKHTIGVRFFRSVFSSLAFPHWDRNIPRGRSGVVMATHHHNPSHVTLPFRLGGGG
jgi:hypothetical protein